MEKPSEVTPLFTVSWRYVISSWSARMSNNRHVASSDPVAASA